MQRILKNGSSYQNNTIKNLIKSQILLFLPQLN
jgi:hypothetical protein